MKQPDILAKCRATGGYFGAFRESGDRYFTMPIMESIMFRMIPTCSHADSDVEVTLAAFRELRDTLCVGIEADWTDVDAMYGARGEG